MPQTLLLPCASMGTCTSHQFYKIMRYCEILYTSIHQLSVTDVLYPAWNHFCWGIAVGRALLSHCSAAPWHEALRSVRFNYKDSAKRSAKVSIAFILNSSEVIETSTGVAALHKNAHKQVHLTVVALPRVPPFAHIAEMLGARHRHRCQPAKRPGWQLSESLWKVELESGKRHEMNYDDLWNEHKWS